MQCKAVAYTEKDGIVHVKLNRPEKRNALNFEIIREIPQCFAEVATLPNVQVALLSSDDIFSSDSHPTLTFSAQPL